jgi:hypothetical protein
LHEYALRYFFTLLPKHSSKPCVNRALSTDYVRSATEIEWPIDGDPRLHDKPSVLEKAEPHLQARVESQFLDCGPSFGRIRSPTRPPTTTLKHSLPFLTTASISHSSKLSGNHYNHSESHPLHSLREHTHINTKDTRDKQSTVNMVSLSKSNCSPPHTRLPILSIQATESPYISNAANVSHCAFSDTKGFLC